MIVSFSKNEIVKGKGFGTFVILGLRNVGDTPCAQLKEVHSDDVVVGFDAFGGTSYPRLKDNARLASGEICLPLDSLKKYL